ncbi:hypothetical protein L3X38_021214 [Prunus dulcis]|uniref:Uncharacterized protein n=1 Tax=Prunus dulcis TaxID=3755 RepID=A0AAD4Z405_PRUDU|nr:hypothetical protein L3X38_021214 [Prunus dulcis]
MLPYFPKLEEISISRRSQSKQVEEESNSEEPVSDASLAIHDPRLEKQKLDELVWVDPLELNKTKYKGEKTVTPDGQIIWSFLKLNMEIQYCLQPKPRLVCLLSRDERAALRGGSETQNSRHSKHSRAAQDPLRIPVSLLPLHDLHDSHNSARGLPSGVVSY